MVDTGLRILVVGAGIAGLAATRALRLAGFRPEVVDREPASMAPGVGIYLPGNAARALRELGLHEPMQPLGSILTQHRFHDARGRMLWAVDAGQLWGELGECRALPRRDLHQVLLTGAGGVVRFDTAVRELALDENTATVTFSDDTTAGYDLVVGADGRRSTVRRLAGLGGAPEPLGQLAYRWTVSGDPAASGSTTLLGRRTAFVVMPIGARQLYCYAEQAVRPGEPPQSDPVARLRAIFGGFGGPVPELLAAAGTVRTASLEEVTLDRWHRGPVLLIGDAAHAMSPNVTQGAAMGLEDGLVLAESLRGADSVAQALDRYEQRRRPRIRWVHALAHRRDRTRDLPPALRDPMVRLLGGRVFHGDQRRLLAPR